MFRLEITAQDGQARTGILHTAHGPVQTPFFMPVGTLGAAKGLTHTQLREAGAELLLMNAFHLAWRPGEELVRELGGLHRFTGWEGPILTDSGGFQVFSLAGLRKIEEGGVTFASPVDGRVRYFSPEAVVEIQAALAPDVIMQLDHCPALPCSAEDLEAAVDRSARWARRSLARFGELAPAGVNLFGIVQGGSSEGHRRRSVEAICGLPFAGFALGGFSVGEKAESTHAGIAFSAPLLPVEKPRYLMGMGTPVDILHAVSCGLDMFDCTLPTRNGRNALAYTSEGPIRLRNAKYARDERPLDPSGVGFPGGHVSRAYLRHLFLAREMNACILTSLHNVYFYQKLMAEIRAAIRGRRFEDFRKEFLSRYQRTGEGSEGESGLGAEAGPEVAED